MAHPLFEVVEGKIELFVEAQVELVRIFAHTCMILEVEIKNTPKELECVSGV